MHVHDAPIALLLAEHHRRTGDMLGAVAARPGRRLSADPVGFGMPVTSIDGKSAGNDAADVERRPIAAGHVLLIKLPEPGPVLAALVGVAIEVEEHAFRGAAPDLRQRLP